jgi:hypothetical protein
MSDVAPQPDSKAGPLVIEKHRHRPGLPEEVSFYACGPVRRSLEEAQADARAFEELASIRAQLAEKEAALAAERKELRVRNTHLAVAGQVLDEALRNCQCRGIGSTLVPGPAGTWVDKPCVCAELRGRISAPSLARAVELDRARRASIEAWRAYRERAENRQGPGKDPSGLKLWALTVAADNRLRALEAERGGSRGTE